MMHRTDVRIALAVLLLLAGYLVGSLRSGGEPPAAPEAAVAQVWTCSMHPQIRMPGPGKCPICGMDLIPVESGVGDGAGGGDVAALTMSDAAAQLAEIRTTPVRRGIARREVGMVGKVVVDETRLKTIAARVGGRLDRLYVDYAGISIREGDHLVWLYSPELVSAQEELLQALRTSEEIAGGEGNLLRETAAGTVEAARDKLRLLGLTSAQIAQIEERGSVEDHVTIYAPGNGVVMSKLANEGDYVSTGTTIYEIADLGRVWVKLDAYESDLAWLRYGQDVHFTSEALPGQVFEGRIAFIDPVLDSRTRTVKVRVNVDNSSGALKPGLFVRATVRAELTADGHVTTADLTGKWICPMHPEVIKDRSGQCDVCGMDLVRARDLGYEPYPDDAQSPLLIPVTAPLITGRRAVVYVRDPGSEQPRFLGREVVLGPRAGDHYVVESGLAEGEQVVMNGAFKIDSAMQIQARPSMMSPAAPESSPTRSVAPTAFTDQLQAVYSAYLELVTALAADDPEAAATASQAVEHSLIGVDMELLDHAAHTVWMSELSALRPAVQAMLAATDLVARRRALPDLTAALADAIRSFGADSEVRRFHCPMAFDGAGADWLQTDPQTANPYYGAAMLRCGEAVETLVAGEGGR